MMGLGLTKVVRGLIEIARLLKCALSFAERPSASMESLKEWVTEEGCRVLGEVHVVRLLGVIQSLWCFAVVIWLYQRLILRRWRWSVKVEVKVVRMLIDWIERSAVLVEWTGCTQVHVATHAELLTWFVIVEATQWNFWCTRLHVLRVVKWWETSDWWYKWRLDWKFGRYACITCSIRWHILCSQLSLYHLVLLFH